MSGLISQETLRYQYLLVRSEERWVSLLHCFFYFCETYVIFMLEYLTDMCLFHADVEPVQSVDNAKNRSCPWPGATPTTVGGPTTGEDLPAKEAERVLRQVK
jgi:hypothetical protein